LFNYAGLFFLAGAKLGIGVERVLLGFLWAGIGLESKEFSLGRYWDVYWVATGQSTDGIKPGTE